MTDSEVPMLQSRLQVRLRTLGLKSFAEYLAFVLQSAQRKEELVTLIDAVTTNKTDFYREKGHFEYLVNRVLPELDDGRAARSWKAWCAGCSSGEEPYTLAMLLADYGTQRSGSDFAVLATDISTSVLAKARLGIYDAARVIPLPIDLRNRYVMRSRDPKSHVVRIAPELRSRIAFHRLNFMDADYGVADTFDFVFFRNVAIYFDAETQENVVSKLCNHLRPGATYSLANRNHSLACPCRCGASRPRSTARTATPHERS